MRRETRPPAGEAGPSTTLERDLPALHGTEFDLLVIGGGMFGAAAALDAAQRGLSVALIERGDFCGATSANSFKMIHGGIRYLQHADVYRIRHSARARAAFLRTAPHLCHPLPIVVPTYGHGMKSKAVLRLGTAAYDALTFDRNRGIADPSRRIPNAWFLDRAETLRRYPALPADGLSGAGVFCDGQMYNAPRLVLAFVQSAAAAGAVCANYVEAVRLLERDGRVAGALVHDRADGGSFEIRARLVLNAAGPYAEALLRASFGRGLEPATPFSRDAYFIVRRPLIAGEEALTLTSATSDPDAVLSRGGRHLFLVPWRGATLVGVWHKVYPGDPDRYEITEAELASWIAEIDAAYPGLGLSLDEVALGSAGLVPFGENDPDAKDLKFAHRSRIIDHAHTHGRPGLITLVGVRYTTGPVEAVEVVDLACRRLERRTAPSRLEQAPIHGGAITDMAALTAEAARAAPATVDPGVVPGLVRNYGTCCRSLLDLAASHPDYAACLPGSGVIGAEIVHAARHEMALTLADAVFRRTDLCATGHPGAEALRQAARLMAQVGRWSEARVDAELDFVTDRLRLARTGRAFLADAAAPRELVA